MDSNDTIIPAGNNAAKRIPWVSAIVGCVVVFLVALSVSLLGYRLGFANGEKLGAHVPISPLKPVTKKAVIKKNIEDAGVSSSTNASGQENTYNVFYTLPAGWKAMIWHPDQDSVGTALLSPDYTSIDDPSPQTGFSVLLYQFPGNFSSMAELKPEVEQTEEGMLNLTQTTIAGYPAYQAVFSDSDSGRILVDYDILKGNDRWLVRFDYPGNTYAVVQQVEQRNSVQINQLLQSIQFKAIQYQ